MPKSSFIDLLKGNEPIVVDFFADWCGPCKMMKPELDNLKAQLGDNVRIIKIDVDKNQSLANSYRVQSVPTLMIFKNGVLKWRQAGVVTAAQLRQVIQEI